LLRLGTLIDNNKFSGVDRAKFIMQGTYYDFTTLFSKESLAGASEIKNLYSAAGVYKDALSKFLMSLKLTISMYQDNPFLIESFAQVYFQGHRQKLTSDHAMITWNSSGIDIPKTAYLSSLDADTINVTKVVMPKF